MKHKIIHTCVFAFCTTILVGANLVADYFAPQVTEILEPSTHIVQGDTNSKAISEQIATEGAVLLENKANTLPLKNVNKINLFGYSSTASVYGGSGSGAVHTKACVTLIDALKNVGIENNDELTQMYKNWAGKNGLPKDGSRKDTPIYNGDWSIKEPGAGDPIYREANMEKWYEYSDKAIFTLARVSGEGTDLPKGENGDGSQDYLKLTTQEIAAIERVYDHFGDNLIILINSANTIEIAPLLELGIKTIVYMPAPGQYGFNGLANLLVGKNGNEPVSFSGRLAATYEVDHSTNPAYYKSGKLGTLRYNGRSNKSYVEYAEGIYVGYRYYETRAIDEGEEWYKNNVLYPFGYGLSYTTFEHELLNVSVNELTNENLSEDVKATVKVTNTGNYPSKEAVQLYVSKPYTAGEIEKPAVELIDFGKTKVLAPGESQTFTLSFRTQELASYDYNDANKNGYKGYEIESGNYAISLRNNSHEISKNGSKEQTKVIKVASDLKIEKDFKTQNEIKNLFDFVNGYDIDYLQRDKWNVAEYTNKGKAAPDSVVNESCDKIKGKITAKDKELFSGEMPITGAKTNYEFRWGYSDEELAANEAKEEFSAAKNNYEKAQKTIVDWSTTPYDDPLWDKLLDQMTVEDYKTLINAGGYQTAEIKSINKSLTKDVDGPQGLKLDQGGVGTNNSFGTAYPCENLIAQTFNKDLAYTMGASIAKEGVASKVTGWYGPGMNIQRSAYEGRYYEYYSEDPIISGYMGAYAIRGSLEEGMRPYMKHFALNEQEEHRDDVVTWCNEQAMREIYLKPFEFAVKIGEVSCVMSAFNDIGPVWAGACRPLLTDLLRTEWGFRGMVLTDYYANWMPAGAAIRAGNDIMLSPTQNSNLSINASDPYSVNAAREACKNILYAVSKSTSKVSYASREGLPVWIQCGIAADVVISLGLITYMLFNFDVFKLIKKACKKKEDEPTEEVNN